MSKPLEEGVVPKHGRLLREWFLRSRRLRVDPRRTCGDRGGELRRSESGSKVRVTDDRVSGATPVGGSGPRRPVGPLLSGKGVSKKCLSREWEDQGRRPV